MGGYICRTCRNNLVRRPNGRCVACQRVAGTCFADHSRKSMFERVTAYVVRKTGQPRHTWEPRPSHPNNARVNRLLYRICGIDPNPAALRLETHDQANERRRLVLLQRVA